MKYIIKWERNTFISKTFNSLTPSFLTLRKKVINTIRHSICQQTFPFKEETVFIQLKNKRNRETFK